MGSKISDDIAFDVFPGNIINNAVVPTEKTDHPVDPSTGKPLWAVPVATPADLDAAVRSARLAQPAWASKPWTERARHLLALADELDRLAPDLTKLLAVECGKPATIAGFEAHSASLLLRGYAALEVADEIVDETDERVVYATHVALGVVAGIVPWNFPLALAIVKVGPALLTGNCVVLKPSPMAPCAVLKMVELAARVLPPGVVQVLNGDADLGRLLTEHSGVDMVSFTGSSATGKLVARSCGASLKRVLLELGGNDAAVVLPDVNVAEVVPQIAQAAFMHAGQICLAVKRIYVHESIYDEFRDGIVKFVKENVKVGGIFEENVLVGPVQNKMQYDFVKGLFEDVRKQGHRIALDGGPRDDKDGFFIQPAIIDDPPEDSRVVAEEAFGPIVPLLRWKSEDDVVARANALRAGLGASVWSADIAHAEAVARRLEAGSVWINAHFRSEPHIPVSGFKDSGIGIENGVAGLKSYMNHRSLWVPKKKT